MPAQYTNSDKPGLPQLVHVTYSREVHNDPDGPGFGEGPFYGVQAVASFLIPIGGGSFHMVEVRSGGLWGIAVEGDEDDPYLETVYQEELASLKGELECLAQAITRGALIVRS